MKKLLAVLTFVLLSACTTKTSHLTVVVPGDIVFAVDDLNRATARPNVSASETSPIILLFPVGMPNFQTILNDALHKGDGDAMTNITITEEFRWYVLFGYNKLTINGTVVNTHR